MDSHAPEGYYPHWEEDEPCWLFAGSIDPKGYGTVFNNGKNLKAHRVMYESEIGEIPDGLIIDHLCRVRACINPAHMEVVDNATNVMRGEAPSAQNARKTHCKKGHELIGENIRLRNNGWRICKVCQSGWQRIYMAKRNSTSY